MKPSIHSTVLFLFVSHFSVQFGSAGPNPEHRKILLKGYDKIAIPSGEAGPIRVQVNGLSLNSIDINEKHQTISLQAWLSMDWIDPRLSWGTETKLENDGYLHFDHGEVWTPDLAVFNGAESTKILEFFGKSQVLSGFNGSVIWVPPIKATAHCELNLKRWPHDTQTCEVKIGSWTYSEDEVNVTLADGPAVNHESTLNNTEWELLGAEARRESREYDCCPGSNYVTIHYKFTLHRKSCSYTYTAVIPLLLIILINVVVLLLPKNRGEKLTLGIFNFLVATIFLLYLSSKLPALDHTPLIVVMYGLNLIFTAIIIAVSAVVINFTDGTPIRGTPKWTHWTFNRTVASIFCLKSLQKLTNAKRDGRSYSFKTGGTAGNGSVAMEDPMLVEQPKPKETDGGNKAEWLYLAAFVDRLTLHIYLNVCISLFFVFYIMF
ncbi:unnamed protein product [Allacma fusca]|uniref:Uncharacterized protein n=1 Tax=Allacma fusca TaxID=39272 RepID=A0A8J2JFN3_9HEXA|nr:unnamed protein product [Allacma fusca]